METAALTWLARQLAWETRLSELREHEAVVDSEVGDFEAARAA